MRRLWWMLLIASILVPAFLSGVSGKRQQQNLIAFTKLWGYAKNFYPGDEAQDIDWDKLSVYGSAQVIDSPDKKALANKLDELFSPLLPDLVLYTRSHQIGSSKEPTKGRKKSFWQHRGMNGSSSSLFGSQRTNRPFKVPRNQQYPFSWASICPQLPDSISFVPELRISFKVKQRGEESDSIFVSVSVSDEYFTNTFEARQWQEKSIVLSPKERVYNSIWMMFAYFEELLVDDLKVEVLEQDTWREVYYNDFENDTPGSLPWDLSVNIDPYRGILSSEVDAFVQTDNDNNVLCLSKAEPGKPHTQGIVNKIFMEELPWGERLDIELLSGLRANFPMVLECDLEHTYPIADSLKLKKLKEKLEPIDLSDRSSKSIWLAGLIKYWTDLNFFYPYFEYNICDWDKELGSSLKAVLKVKTFAEYKRELLKLSAKTQDGHANLEDPSRNKLIAGFGVNHISGKWVVTKVLDESLDLPTGSELTHMNDRSFKKIMAECRSLYFSSNPETTELRLFRAYQRDYPDSVATFRFITPDKRKINKQVKFGDYNSHYLKIRDEKQIVYPDSIVYLNLYRITDEEITALMPQLLSAKGIILDLRLYPHVSSDILKHFLSKPDTWGSSIAKRYIKPHQELPRLDEDKPTWSLEPEEPHLKAKLIALSSRDSQSYCEVFLSIIKHNELGTIIGQPSAGANGNVVYSNLPGNLKVQWTCIFVRNPDKSRFFTLGVSPDIQVTKTLEDAVLGRDPELEQALQLIRE